VGGQGSGRHHRKPKVDVPLPAAEGPYTFSLPGSFVKRLEREAKALEEVHRLRKENAILRRVKSPELKQARRDNKFLKNRIRYLQIRLKSIGDKIQAFLRSSSAEMSTHWSKRPGVDPQKVARWQQRMGRTKAAMAADARKGGKLIRDRFPNGKIRERFIPAASLARMGKKNGGKPKRDAQGHFFKKDGTPPKPVKYSDAARERMREAGKRTAALLKKRAEERREQARKDQKAVADAGAAVGAAVAKLEEKA
jgi:hypothetical protein